MSNKYINYALVEQQLKYKQKEICSKTEVANI